MEPYAEIKSKIKYVYSYLKGSCLIYCANLIGLKI